MNLVKSFDHPHVLRFVGVCCEPPHVCIGARPLPSFLHARSVGDTPFLWGLHTRTVTEYMAGGSLFDVLHPKGYGMDTLVRFSLLRALHYSCGIAAGMAYVHARGIMHRDLKSGNLLLDAAREHIKVGDFGVARHLNPLGDDSMTAETGTYRWMAPEVITHAKQYDMRVDVYSFAIVLWEMLTGELPYGHLSPVQAASAVVHNHLRPTIDGVRVPNNLGAIMRACWHRDSDARPHFDVILLEMKRLHALETNHAGSAASAEPPAWASQYSMQEESSGGRRRRTSSEGKNRAASAADRSEHAGQGGAASMIDVDEDVGAMEMIASPRMSEAGVPLRRLSSVLKENPLGSKVAASQSDSLLMASVAELPASSGAEQSASSQQKRAPPRRGLLGQVFTCCEVQAGLSQ